MVNLGWAKKCRLRIVLASGYNYASTILFTALPVCLRDPHARYIETSETSLPDKTNTAADSISIQQWTVQFMMIGNFPELFFID